MKFFKDNIEVLIIAVTLLVMLAVIICCWDIINPKIQANKDSLAFISSLFGIVIALSSFFYTSYRMRRNKEEEQAERERNEKSEIILLGNCFASILASFCYTLLYYINRNNNTKITPPDKINYRDLYKISLISSEGVGHFQTLLSNIDQGNSLNNISKLIIYYINIIRILLVLQNDATKNNFQLTITKSPHIVFGSNSLNSSKNILRGIIDLYENMNKPEDKQEILSILGFKSIDEFINAYKNNPNDILNGIKAH